MYRSHQHMLFLGILLTMIFYYAWILQSQMLLKGDVVWGMHMAQALLSGGNYINQFFEVNPPLIIFIYMPAVFIAKYLSVTNTIATRIDIFLLSAVSLSLVHYLIKKFFLEKDTLLAVLTIAMLAFAFLILPGNEFGQRENQIMILTAPYLFLMAARLKNISIPWTIALIIGLCAGIGFAIKPFYTLTFFMLEIYYWLMIKRNARSFLTRPELYALLIFMLIYFAIILIFFKSYTHIVVPLALNFYFQNFSDTWRTMLLSPIFTYCAISLFFYFSYFFLLKLIKFNHQAITHYQPLLQIFFLSLTGFLIAYLYQKINWYYHIIPAFYLAMLMDFILVFLFLRTKKSVIPNTLIYFFLLFTWIWIWFNSHIKMSAFIIIYLSPITTLLYLIIFLYFLSFGFKKQRFLFFMLSALSILIYLFPILTIDIQNEKGIEQKRILTPLAAYLAEHSHHRSVYFISAHAAYMNSVLDLANVSLTSRLQFLFWARKINGIPHFQSINNYFASMLACDIEKNRPRLILVDRVRYAINTQARQINELSILLQNRHFYHVWQHYKLVNRLGNPFLYQFDVYQRTT